MEPRSQEEVFPRTVSMHSCSLAAVAGSSMYCRDGWGEREGWGAVGEREGWVGVGGISV